VPVRDGRGPSGQDVVDAFFDLALEDDCSPQFPSAIMNTTRPSVAEIFNHPRSLIASPTRART